MLLSMNAVCGMPQTGALSLADEYLFAGQLLLSREVRIDASHGTEFRPGGK